MLSDLKSLALKSDKDTLQILDQTLLPREIRWLRIDSIDQMISAIQKLQIRGAPLIAVGAALSFAHALASKLPRTDWPKEIEKLRSSRPTAVNLVNAMDKISALIGETDEVSEIIRLCESFFIDDAKLCDELGVNGAGLIAKNDQVLTHCNTGGLATAGLGTALAAIITAHKQEKSIHVWVDETRPLLQGGRLTSWELSQAQVPYHLICDSMAAHLMSQGKVQKVLVGADRIAINGDFANKIGTYSLAVNAFFHRIPFYVVAPRTTIDINCNSGRDIPIEEREAREIWGVRGSFGEVSWAPERAPVYNPAFDITPHDLVTGWIFENGVYNAQQIKAGALKR